jgi:hypothetical protein
MLVEMRCDQLVKKRLEFKKGLNALIGPDDGTNSIGKSSVLMLIDFALSGDDFIKLCSDTITNIGVINIEMDFIFEGIKYSFHRSTQDPNAVVFMNENGNVEKSIDEYRAFLKASYVFPEGTSSFRGAVNPFFRIWGKENYNPNKPLQSFPSEPYKNIKPFLLKLFSYYSAIKNLEDGRRAIVKRQTVLKGAFAEGYIKPLTQKERISCEKRLKEVESEIHLIKGSIEAFSINASQIINEKNLNIKSEKDQLIKALLNLKGRLKRVDDNLTYGNTVNKKYFDKLEAYFPNVRIDKLSKIDQFHSGVTKILKADLRAEKLDLSQQITALENEISEIDSFLLQSLNMLETPAGLVDKMLELYFEEKSLIEQVRFRDIKIKIDQDVLILSDKVKEKELESLSEIQKVLNSTMSEYINLFYQNNPVLPEIKLFETRYEFCHHNDSGTGKAYANMIAMDMSFLDKTYLPILIHDLIVFSNIEDHATEEIFKAYSKSQKQVFIAIDKLGRFNTSMQELTKQNSFLTLGANKLAFGRRWNTSE